MSKLKEDEHINTISSSFNLINTSSLPVIEEEEENQEKFTVLMDVLEGAIEEMKKRSDDLSRLDQTVMQLNKITNQIKENDSNNPKSLSFFDFDLCFNYSASLFIIFGFFVLIGSALFIGIFIGHLIST